MAAVHMNSTIAFAVCWVVSALPCCHWLE